MYIVLQGTNLSHGYQPIIFLVLISILLGIIMLISLSYTTFLSERSVRVLHVVNNFCIWPGFRLFKSTLPLVTSLCEILDIFCILYMVHL